MVTSVAAVAFSATAGLEPPLRNLITFASFSAKQHCSSVLMAGMDPEQVLNEDLAAGQGMIHTRIKPNAGRVEASTHWLCLAPERNSRRRTAGDR